MNLPPNEYRDLAIKLAGAVSAARQEIIGAATPDIVGLDGVVKRDPPRWWFAYQLGVVEGLLADADYLAHRVSKLREDESQASQPSADESEKHGSRWVDRFADRCDEGQLAPVLDTIKKTLAKHGYDIEWTRTSEEPGL
jgi:hypothetical protein